MDVEERLASRDYEVRLILAMIHNSRFRDFSIKSIREESFREWDTAHLFDLILSQHRKSKPITFFSIYELAKRDTRLSEAKAEEACAIVKPYIEPDFDNRKLDAVVEGVVTFVEEETKKRLTQEALVKSSELHDLGKYDDISALWRKVTTESIYQPAPKHFMWASITEHGGDLMAAIDYKPGIPTGIVGKAPNGSMMGLDQVLFFKGVGRGQQIIFLGDSSLGKTTLVWNCALYQSLLGYRVAYYSLEVPTRYLQVRAVSAFMGISTDEAVAEGKSSRVVKKIDEIHEQYPKMQDIELFDYSSSFLSIPTIAYNLMIAEREGNPIDFLYVDYVDLLKSDKGYREKRHEIGQNTIDLRSLGNEYGCAVGTPSQMSKSTFQERKKGELRGRNAMSEDYSKVRTCDILVSLNQKFEETQDVRGATVKKEVVIATLDKNRYGKEGLNLALYPNKDSGRYFNVLPRVQ